LCECLVLPDITHRSALWFNFILCQFWKQKFFIVGVLPAEPVRQLEYGQAPTLRAMLAGPSMVVTSVSNDKQVPAFGGKC